MHFVLLCCRFFVLWTAGEVLRWQKNFPWAGGQYQKPWPVISQGPPHNVRHQFPNLGSTMFFSKELFFMHTKIILLPPRSYITIRSNPNPRSWNCRCCCWSCCGHTQLLFGRTREPQWRLETRTQRALRKHWNPNRHAREKASGPTMAANSSAGKGTWQKKSGHLRLVVGLSIRQRETHKLHFKRCALRNPTSTTTKPVNM